MLDWRLAAYRKWLDMPTPEWARGALPAHRLPVDLLLLGAEEEGAPRAWTRSTRAAETYEKLGIPIEEQKALAGVAVDAVFDSVSVATTFRETSSPRRASSSARSPRRSRNTRSWCEVPRHRRAADRQLLRRAQLRGVHRRHLRLHAEEHPLPDGAQHLLPHQRRRHRPVRAHADRRRRGQLRQLPGGLHRAERDENQLHAAVVELIAMETPRSSTRRCRTGTPATRTARAASTTSSPSAATAAAEFQDQLDPGGDRLGHHLEVPELHPARRRLGRRVLLGGRDQGRQQADTGTKMIHIGQEHQLTIVSKGISAQRGQNRPTAGWCGRRQKAEGRGTTPSATPC
jgi:Fe-S cluster assembly protein SufB